jgi:hypothetical protein
MDESGTQEVRFRRVEAEAPSGLLLVAGRLDADAVSMVDQPRPNADAIVAFERAPLGVRVEQQVGLRERAPKDQVIGSPARRRVCLVDEDLDLRTPPHE